MLALLCAAFLLGTASFDQPLALLAGIGASARLVTDPVPFLATEKPPLYR